MSRIDPTVACRAADAVPSIPRDAEGPVFREPWEAQAFRDAWDRAAERTPHGTPIALKPEDFAD